jgi:DNA-binding NtrC family response regulator
VPSIQVLVVDDDAFVREDLLALLGRRGLDAQGARDGLEAVAMLGRKHFDIVLLDLDLPRKPGLEVLNWIREHQNTVETIVISGKATIRQAVDAVRGGAYDLLEKPVNAERLMAVVRNLVELIRVRRERDTLRDSDIRKDAGLVGVSPVMESLRQQILRAGPVQVSVLVTGESGTGKELVARAIHASSPRRDGPFVAVNCSAIPESLIESNLFGHEKGAFTGAEKAHPGRFQMADTGSLFLDEIGEMSPDVQAKLLRVLDDGLVEAVGALRPRQLNVRLIAATNRDLEAEDAPSFMRRDLYHRLNVLRIHVPPLRERLEDVPSLVEHFAHLFCARHSLSSHVFSPGAILSLSDRSWPGNVRELRNMVERSIVASDSLTVNRDCVLRASNPLGGPEVLRIEVETTLRAARLKFESEYIVRVLDEHDWKIQESATALGISRAHLWKKMKAYAIDSPG